MQPASRAIIATRRVASMPAQWGLGGVFLMIAQAGCCQATGVEGVLTLASDWTDRGLLLGQRKPVLQGELSVWLDSKWSASLAATVQDEPVRIAARLTRYWALSNDWQADVGLGWYDYRSGSAGGFQYAELGTSMAFRDLVSLGASARQYTGRLTSLRWAFDAGLRWPIAREWSVNGSAGWAQLPTQWTRWYRYGSAGVDWQHGPWRAGLHRIGTDSAARRQFGGDAQSHWSAFAARDF